MKNFLTFFTAFGCLLHFSLAADIPTKRTRLNEFYTAIPMPNTQQMDTAGWIVTPKPNAAPTGVEKAADLIAHFRGTDLAAIKNGIFIHSLTHSTDYSKAELARLDQRIVDQVNHQAWRSAENKLVSELVTTANKEGVPVWALKKTSGELYTYTLLTDPKLTLKK